MPYADDLVSLANAARTRIREISPDEAFRRVASGSIVIDVREEKEYWTGHIKGAKRIGREELETEISEFVPGHSTPIVCYCTVGHRSAIAADVLQKLGYRDVASIQGGLKAYQARANLLRSG